MAIVLPQGRFNNSSDKNIRDFIAERCRILAVVGLHGNTFKPHTGTKTSVLFVQKWNDDPKAGALCPRQDDYNIFFATMRKSGKDNSGDKIWRKISSSSSPPDDELSELMPPSPMQRVVGVEGDFLQDVHGHLVVDHDLYNHEGLTKDGIAEAFIEFAKKEKLSFFESSPSVTPFDAVRYRRLMDGLEATELSLSEVVKHNITFRVDSEFFETKYLKVEQAINSKTNTLLDTLAGWITQGPNPNFSEDESGVHCLNGRNIAGGTVTYEGSDYVSESEYQILDRFQIQKNDILITLKGYGSIGKIGFVNTARKSIFSRDVGIIRLKKNIINPAYLFVFLLSKHGILTIDRGNTGGTGQRTLTTTYLKNMYIPRFEFEDFVGKFVRTSEELFEQSSLIYQQAEDLLLSELGLKDWQPTEENVAVKSFAESFLSSGRFDAEYYQPKYDEVEQYIKKYSGGWDCLGNKFSVETGEYSEQYFHKSENLKFYIRNTNIVNGQIKVDEAYYVSPDNFSKFAQEGDILTARVGAIGSFGTVEKDLNGSIYSDNVLCLRRIQVENMLPDVYILYFNTKPNRELMNKLSGGSVQPLITQTSIKTLPIPILHSQFQQKINSKINESFELKLKSKQLLEIAKTGVERAIETDEATATAWINQQLEALGINLSNSN